LNPYQTLRTAASRVATVTASTLSKHRLGISLLKAAPIPGKRQLVQHLPAASLPRHLRAQSNGMHLDLDLSQHLDRNVFFEVYERADLGLAERMAPVGGTVFDVGANIGVYTLQLARKVGPRGRVHAFEPDPDNYARLTDHCRLNGVEERVKLNRTALSEESGEMQLHRIQGQSADSTLAGFGRDWPLSETIRTHTIDDYMRQHDITSIDLAKIDVEGHEFQVLRGARKALETQAIASLLIEFNGGRLQEEGHTLEEFMSVLHGFGYVPVQRNLLLLRALRKGLIPAGDVCINFLFQPQRRPQ
jgi:FkbM family methyltransferase